MVQAARRCWARTQEISKFIFYTCNANMESDIYISSHNQPSTYSLGGHIKLAFAADAGSRTPAKLLVDTLRLLAKPAPWFRPPRLAPLRRCVFESCFIASPFRLSLPKVFIIFIFRILWNTRYRVHCAPLVPQTGIVRCVLKLGSKQSSGLLVRFPAE